MAEARPFFQPQFFLKALVDVSLSGGFDSTELVIPNGEREDRQGCRGWPSYFKGSFGSRSDAFRGKWSLRRGTFTGSLGLILS